MPRPRKPLAQQTGNLTVLQQEKRKREEELVETNKDRLNDPPEYLTNEIAIEEWNSVTDELKKINIVGNLDLGNLVVYCNAFADYVEATTEIERQDKVIERFTQTGSILVRNPWIDLQKNYAEEMRKAGSKVGIDVNARLKAASIKASEEQEDVRKKFGGI